MVDKAALNTLLLKKKKRKRILHGSFVLFSLWGDGNWIVLFKNMSGGKMPCVLNGCIFVWETNALFSLSILILFLHNRFVQRRHFLWGTKGQRPDIRGKADGTLSSSYCQLTFGQKSTNHERKFGNSPFLHRLSWAFKCFLHSSTLHSFSNVYIYAMWQDVIMTGLVI